MIAYAIICSFIIGVTYGQRETVFSCSFTDDCGFTFHQFQPHYDPSTPYNDWQVTSDPSTLPTGPTSGYDSAGGWLKFVTAGRVVNGASAVGIGLSPLLDGTSWTDDVELSFFYYAYGRDLGSLWFSILGSGGLNTVLVHRRIFEDFSRSRQMQEWRHFTVIFNPRRFGNDGRIKIEFSANTYGRRGEFGIDAVRITTIVRGNCSNHRCDSNATCAMDERALAGYTCTCNPGYSGTDGFNVNSGGTECTAINRCNEGDICGRNGTCHYEGPGNYSCECDPGFRYDGICVDRDECRENPDSPCQNNTNCMNYPGRFSCRCIRGYTGYPRTYDVMMNCYANGNWTAWIPSGTCNATTTNGTIIERRTCSNPPPEPPYGENCTGPTMRYTQCDSCDVLKNCTCRNVTIIKEDSYLDLTLRYFPGVSPHDLNTTLSLLGRWNKTAVDLLCNTAQCDGHKLGRIVSNLDRDVDSLERMTRAYQWAKNRMRDILDCNPSKLDDHNYRLWNVFDKLLEHCAYIPNILEDLKIKKMQLEAERDRCNQRSVVRSLIENMYRKW